MPLFISESKFYHKNNINNIFKKIIAHKCTFESRMFYKNMNY